MAARCVYRSLRFLQRQAVTPVSIAGLENGAVQSSRQTYTSRNIKKQYLSNLDSSWSPFSKVSSSEQKRVCCVSSRTYVTHHKERLDEEVNVSQSSSSTPVETSTDPTSGIQSTGDETSIPSENVAVDSAFKASPRHDMALLFTCVVCDVRSAKTMSRATYETGVVIVRCPGCQNLHLIADRYGWFGEPGSVEDFLAKKGIDVRKGSDRSYEFTVEDMSGWTPKGKPEQ
ncbi:unnamed protein product [Calypogeia fissa]